MARQGMDADAVEGIAQRIHSRSTEATSIVASAGRLIRGSERLWLGQRADRWLADWLTEEAAVRNAAGFLEEMSQRLAKQALQQRTASGGGSWRPSADPSRRKPTAPSQRLIDEMRDVRGRTPDEQLRWWNGLSQQERDALMQALPGELTALVGLPSSVLLAAQKAYFSQISAQVVATTVKKSVEVEATVKIVKASVGGECTKTTYKDGSVALTFKGEVAAGVGAKLDGVGVTAKGDGAASVTYRFANEAEAQQFLRDLEDAVTPQFSDLNPFHENRLAKFLDQHSRDIESVAFEAGSDAGVDIGVGDGKVGAAVTVSADGAAGDPGKVTIQAEGHVSGSVHVEGPGYGVQGEAEVSAAVSLKDGEPSSISFDFSGKSGPMVGAWAGVIEASMGASAEASYHVEFDLNDPVVASHAEAVAAAMARGDVEAAVRELEQVADRALIVVQTNVTVEEQGKVDLAVISGEYNSSTSQNTATLVKPPGGTFFREEQ